MLPLRMKAARSTTMTIDYLTPEWPAPPGVRAVSTTRIGGISKGPWQGLNLATHVDDDPADVLANRELLKMNLALPAQPRWLTQVHGRSVCELPVASDDCEADAASTKQPGEVCVVMTADCLPVLFCDRSGSTVAAAHAGWRGLAGGVLEASLQAFDDPAEVMAWLGPAIGPESFEVGDEVREAFVSSHPRSETAFVATRPGHWLADIYALARIRLADAGVKAVYGGGLCTFLDAERFYSFRRDQITGRMASLIWIEPQRW